MVILCVQLFTLYVLWPFLLWFPGLGNTVAALEVAKVAIVSGYVVPGAIMNH